MADVKISGLPASTTPLAGTEVLPIVQGTTTKKVAVSDLTAGRAVSALSLTSTNNASINTLTVGLGTGNVATTTAVGYQALNATNTGANNSAFGYQALLVNTSGNSNVVIGHQAGYSNTTGQHNTYSGYRAGFTATTANFNTAYGYQALQTNLDGQQNSAFGRGAASFSTGSLITAIGHNALYSTTTGSNLVALGNNAGYGAAGVNANTTGSNNTYIGYQTVGSAATNTNEMVIGYTAVGNGSNTTTIGNSSTTNTIIPAGNATLTNGNLVMGTAAKGIDFSINPNPGGMTSELLNDYEEGTWTPVDSSGAGLSLTNTSGNCFYTKVGNLVNLVFRFTIPVTANTATLTIGGFPFTPKSLTSGNFAGMFSFTNYGTASTIATDGSGRLSIFSFSGAAVTNDLASGKDFRGVITYMA